MIKRLMSKVNYFMEALNSSAKRRFARYLDAILFIAALLLISSLLEVIKI